MLPISIFCLVRGVQDANMGIKGLLIAYLGMIPCCMMIALLILYFIEDLKNFVVADTKTKIGMLITFILGILIVISKVMERNGK